MDGMNEIHSEHYKSQYYMQQERKLTRKRLLFIGEKFQQNKANRMYFTLLPDFTTSLSQGNLLFLK